VLFKRFAAAVGAGCVCYSSSLSHAAPTPPLPTPVASAPALWPGLNPEERDEAVATHNRWRMRVGVAPLRWSVALAQRAQAWANNLAQNNQCKMLYSGSDAGENIFWAGPRTWPTGRVGVNPLTPSLVIDHWGQQSRWYDYPSNTCQTDQVCGHYTQLIWSETTTFGCGRQVCPDQGQIWVCQYSPAGNIQGMRPY